MVQNFDGGKKLTNLTNFQQFVNIFPVKIFRLVSCLTADEFVAIRLHPK